MNLTHLDKQNNPQMVDVSNKDSTERIARARGEIKMSKEAFLAVINQKTKKGPVLQTAVIAAIMAAKKTSDLIPMCHPLFLTSVDCKINEMPEKYTFELIVSVKTKGQTGVEMEALMAVSIGLLTIYDMVKAIDKAMEISQICLLEKSGGKSGDYKRSDEA